MELTLDEALQKGVEAHKAGQLQEADRYYTAILKVQPKHPDANHNMGVLAVGVGKVKEALPFFKTALEVNSNIPQFWLSHINLRLDVDLRQYQHLDTIVIINSLNHHAKNIKMRPELIKIVVLNNINTNLKFEIYFDKCSFDFKCLRKV